jgi:glycine reductase
MEDILVSQELRVVHYLNQFFGGLGGEEKADATPQAVDDPVGPGRAITGALGDRGRVVGTVICGDNYFADHEKEALDEVLSLVRAYEPDILFAGPTFNAGRYGVASGQLCKAVNEKLGIPAVTAMYEENPGTDLYRSDVYIVKTDESVKGMNDAVSKMVSIGLRLAADEPIGRPSDEGYFPRGIIKNEFRDRNAAERAVDMVLARIKGDPFEPELDLPKFEHVKPALLEKDLSKATVALATDGGLVPKGNPDKMDSSRSTRYAVYNIKGLATLKPEAFEANHMGFDTDLVNEDPNRLVPLDVLRELEREGVIGKVHDEVYTTAGVATSLKNAENIAQGIAEAMKSGGVDAVILTST